MKPVQVLLIDDEAAAATIVRGVAESLGYDMSFVDRGRAPKTIEGSLQADLVILNLVMPAPDGIELLQILARTGCRAKILLMSDADATVSQSALHLGEALGLRLLGVMPKPICITQLRSVLERLKHER